LGGHVKYNATQLNSTQEIKHLLVKNLQLKQEFLKEIA
jgi:hypothetical protein